jgi:hypothetical protein
MLLCRNCGRESRDPGGVPIGYLCWFCGRRTLVRVPRQATQGDPVVGLVAGAAIGAAMGGPSGAIIGAIIGGIVGANRPKAPRQ